MSFRKSSRCGSSACVEVDTSHADKGHVDLRESDYPDDVIVVSTPAWAAFVAAVKNGEFDVPEED